MANLGRGLVSKTKKKVESTCRLMPEIFSDLHSHTCERTKPFLRCYGLNSSVLDKHSNTSTAPYFISYTGSWGDVQAGLKLLGSSNSASSVSEYLGLQVCSTEPASFLKTRKLKYGEAYISDQGHHGRNCKVRQ